MTEIATKQNKARRLKAETARQNRNALKRPARLAKRAAGALRRWNRRMPERINEAQKLPEDGRQFRLNELDRISRRVHAAAIARPIR